MGAYVEVVVKYGVITLLRQNLDLCEQMKNIDEECPLKEGPMSVKKDVEIPKEVPPVRFPVNLILVLDETCPPVYAFY